MLTWVVLVTLLLSCTEGDTSLVRELSDSFLNVDTSSEQWFITFYSPSCGHCRRLEPAFDEAARQLAKIKPDINVGRIDATVNRALADKYEVNGYPTIALLSKGDVHVYSGDRSVESMISFVDRMSSDIITKVTTSSDLETMLKGVKKEAVFIYVGEQSSAGNNLYNDFKQMAERRRAYNRFIWVPKSAIFEKLGFKVFRVPSVFSAKSSTDFEEFFPPGKDAFSLPFDQWIISERYSLVPRFTGYDGYAARDINKLVVLLLVKKKPTEPQLEILTRAARTARGRRFLFAWTNDTDTHSRLVGWFVQPISLLCANLSDMSYFNPSDQSIAVPDHNHPNHVISTAENVIDSFVRLSDFIEWVDVIRYSKENRHLLQNLVRGGLGFTMRMRRIFFTVVEFCVTVYNESAILFLLFFGLPLSLFSLLFYLICCTGDHSDGPAFEDLDTSDEEVIDNERLQLGRELEEGAFESDDVGEEGEIRRRPLLRSDDTKNDF